MSDDVRDKIAGFRGEIDEIDCRLVELLNARARLALSIRELKPQANLALFDPKREEEIFLRLAACNEGPLFADNLREIFETVLRVMKEI
jgi:chorismate mutase